MSIRQGGNVIAGNVSHYNIGDTFMTKRTDTNLAGAVECDGATYNTTDFTGSGSIGELLEAGKLDYVSLSAYSTAISTKGWCDKIGWDGAGNTQFRVPTLNAHIVQTNNIPVVGNGMVLGLKNATQNLGLNMISGGALTGYVGDYGASIGKHSGSASNAVGTYGITTDGTKSGIIADTSDTAQLRVMIQIANGATDEALETCTGVLADVATLKGYDYVVESQLPTAQNNYTWYRKYKSGWVEQGGVILNAGTGAHAITIPVEMASVDELKKSAITTPIYINGIIQNQGVTVRNSSDSSWSTTQIDCYSWGATIHIKWQVSGMAAQ